MKRGCPIQDGIMWVGFTMVVILGLQEAMEGRHFSVGTFWHASNGCIYIYIQFICIPESQVVEGSMGSFYTQRF